MKDHGEQQDKGKKKDRPRQQTVCMRNGDDGCEGDKAGAQKGELQAAGVSDTHGSKITQQSVI